MRILNINSYYFSSTVHQQLQSELQTQGIDSYSYVPLSKGYVPRDECSLEIQERVHVANCYKNIDRYFFHMKHRKILSDMEGTINVREFDLLHAHSLVSNGYVALKIKEKYKVPYIVTVRDTDLNTFFKFMVHLRPLGVKIMEKADKIIFLSETYRDALIHRYVPQKLKDQMFTKSKVIPNGIDSFWLNNKGTPKLIHNNKMLNLIHVGAINKRKNIITTIKAVQMLRDKGYNAKLTAVGKVLDRTIFDRTKDLPYVNYIDTVPEENLIQIYRSNDLLVMPSVTETFGLVYAEAMSQGIPVIYSRGQGFDGQFAEGTVGYSVNCYDANEIANRIIDIINNYKEISKNCTELCTKYKWNNIACVYREIYYHVNK